MKKVTLALSILILTSSVSANIIRVPINQPNIQAGVDIANPGDTVLVSDGIYTGDGNRDIDFGGKNLVLMSVNGPQATVIDCQGTASDLYRGFTLSGGEDTTSFIIGFTITNAYTVDFYDAAIICNQASPTLVNCIIDDNFGIGVFYTRATFHMYNCVVSNNTSYGVWIDESPAVITGCEITSNGFDGLFWHAQWYGYEFDMSGCLVRDNDGVGTYLMIGSGIFQVENCTFVGNRTGFIYDWDFPVASDASTTAAEDTSTVENCIMAFNSEYGIISHIWAGDVVVRCNDAYGNLIEDYHEVGVGPGDEYDNISEDPLFCDPEAGDFTLRDNSPCLPYSNTCGELMGAFGKGCVCCVVRGDIDHDGVLLPLDAVAFVDWLWRGGPEPPCLEEADVNGDGDVNPQDCLDLVSHLWNAGPPPIPCP